MRHFDPTQYVELTVHFRCNLSCEHCMIEGTMDRLQPQSMEMLQQVLAHNRATGRWQGLILTGSEVTLRRDLPELTAADFEQVTLDGLAWAHFEGRNPTETAQMIARVRRERPGLPVSVEIEKPRAGIEALFTGADVLIFARAYVQATLGDSAAEPRACLERLAADADARLCLLPWGADGAYGLAAGAAEPVFAPAYPPPELRDSIAAGDVFNAAVIDGLLAWGIDAAATNAGLVALLDGANRLAGFKCGREGLDGLVQDARAAGVFCSPNRET